MKRFAALAVLGVVVGAAVSPLMPRVVQAAACAQPSVTGISVGGVQQQHGPAGARVTLTSSGNNLQSIGCSTSVTINGSNVSNLSTSSGSVSFTVPSPGLSGQLVVSLRDSLGNVNDNSAQKLVYITDPSGNSLDDNTPNASQTVHFLGSNLNFNIGGAELYSAQYVWSHGGSTGSNCPGLPGSPPSLADSSHITLPMPSAYCWGTVTVTLSAPLDLNHTAASDPRMTFPLAAAFQIAPHVSGMSGSGVAGQTETVSGSGFGASTGTVTVNSVSADVFSWADRSITFYIPDSATSGPVQLTRPLDGVTFGPASSLSVSAAISGLSPSSAAVGDPVTVNGSGFGTQQGTVSVGSTSATVQSWSPTSIVFTVPDGATTGAVSLTTNGTTAPSSPPTLTVVAKITGITPSHAQAGSLVEIDGTTFGTSQGTVQIGGADASVTLWGDKSVLVIVPSVSAGQVTAVVTPPGAQAASAPFNVDPTPTSAPTPGSSGSPSSSSTPGKPGSTPTPGIIPPNPSGPIIAHGPVPFTKPKPPPGPVSLKLESTANQADPGNSVSFTVTLMAFGKPLVGAPVDLLMVIEPGADATIDPAHAVTDAQGQVRGTIKLSRTPGDHIVLARSGIYSDEIRVVGRGAQAVTAGNPGAAAGTATPPSDGTALLAVRSPVLWALVSCLLLFGLGFGLNLVTAQAPTAGGAAQLETVQVGLRPRMARSMARMGDAVRFSGGVVAVLGAQLVGRFRRG